ncbi:uncharacterized protein LOC110944593 [Helianthus annuus]|uniref:uncharacterized protein LOC110944593 n=1 Tax=Helianthus annuus TaxID=4232 RepID=UPI000B8F9467|nr:uncharacterized protein LOC110944593 [Helianthus annuus]
MGDLTSKILTLANSLKDMVLIIELPLRIILKRVGKSKFLTGKLKKFYKKLCEPTARIGPINWTMLCGRIVQRTKHRLEQHRKERQLTLGELEEIRNEAYDCAAAYKDKMKKVLQLFPGKLKSKWTGPYRVTKVGKHGNFEIEDFDDHIRQMVNGHRLKPYFNAREINGPGKNVEVLFVSTVREYVE